MDFMLLYVVYFLSLMISMYVVRPMVWKLSFFKVSKSNPILGTNLKSWYDTEYYKTHWESIYKYNLRKYHTNILFFSVGIKRTALINRMTNEQMMSQTKNSSKDYVSLSAIPEAINLIQLMARHRTLTHICITRPQWINLSTYIHHN